MHSCPLTKFEGGLTILHEADDDAVNWLSSVATRASRSRCGNPSDLCQPGLVVDRNQDTTWDVVAREGGGTGNDDGVDDL